MYLSLGLLVGILVCVRHMIARPTPSTTLRPMTAINYYIVSGRCNKFIDESGLFRMIEHVVYKINGVESNAWKLDPKLRVQ